jgi:DNA replication protein DnaC
MNTTQTPTQATPALQKLTSQAAALTVDESCRTLRLPTVAANHHLFAQAATKQRLTHTGFLAELLAVEVDDRHTRRIARRINAAKFPRHKRLTDFDPDPIPDLTTASLASLAEATWIEAGHPVVLLGDSGTGKSHLLIGMGIAAAENDLKVRYTTTAALVNELVEAADAKQLAKTVTRYSRLDLLCLDELGYVHLDPRGAELLFQIITEREERASIAVASNAPFSEWVTTFPDKRLAAAVVDRLTFNATIINTGSQSYRLKNSKTQSRTSKKK